MKRKVKKHKPHEPVDSKEICVICTKCPLPVCNGVCSRFRKEKAKLKRLRNGNDEEKN